MMSANTAKNGVSALLVVSICAVYFQVLDFDFINLDDDQYVTANAQVKAGLSASGLVWAFAEFTSFNWHPLTWLSHMLDVEMFGMDAGGHHATNVVLHIVNSLLLFHFLYTAVRKLWPAAITAALFALHPAHVESVAWVAERKDVLSTAFMLATLLLYQRFAAQPSAKALAAVAACFAAGLMSKPMLVTLPFVLLLLDVWPLDRVALTRQALGERLPALIKEKLPLFLLSAGSVVVTVVAQSSGGAMKAGDVLSGVDKASNAIVSYARYVVKAVYPDDLAIYYPHPGDWDVVSIALSAGLVLSVSVGVFLKAPKHPYLVVGWLWFVGTLVPVIGFVQVGSQAMADRYTYVPYMGLFIAVVYTIDAWASEDTRRERFFQGAAVLVIATFAFLSWQYANVFKDTVSVFTHSLTSTDDAYLALIGQGDAPKELTRPAHSGLYTPYYNLGTEYARLGLLDQARTHFEAAIKAHPGFPEVYINMGVVLAQQGKLKESKRYYEQALVVDPTSELAKQNLEFLRQMMR